MDAFRPTDHTRIAILAPALLLAVFPFASGGEDGGPPPADVRVGRVEQRQVQRHRVITGEIQADRRAVLGAESSGRVVQAPPEAGTFVRGGGSNAGEVLAKLDTDLIDTQLAARRAERKAARAAVRSAKATIRARKAELEKATRQRKRLETLYQRNVAEKKELEDARDDEASARAQWQAAKGERQRKKAQVEELDAKVAELEERRSRKMIRSPFDGYVAEKTAEAGEWLDAGDPVATLVDISVVKAVFDVPESMVDAVRPRGEAFSERLGIPKKKTIPMEWISRMIFADPGTTVANPSTVGKETIQLTRKLRRAARSTVAVHVRVDAVSQSRRGWIYRVVPDGHPRARTFPVFVRLKNEGRRLKPGMTAEVSLAASGKMEALTVPRDAVTLTPSGSVVFASRDGRAALVPVEVRFGVGERFVVSGNLDDGERVVVEGNERLRPGQPLNITGGTE